MWARKCWRESCPISDEKLSTIVNKLDKNGLKNKVMLFRGDKKINVHFARGLDK